jgi:hypothetical protein
MPMPRKGEQGIPRKPAREYIAATPSTTAQSLPARAPRKVALQRKSTKGAY